MTLTEERFAPPAPFDPPPWVEERLGRPTGKGLLVGVIDSGWDRGCDDPRVLPGVGLVDPEDDLAMLRTDDDHDRVGHGTACIHQILRIAPDARVVPIRVFGNTLETSPGTLHAGIVYAMERGVNVVNLSLGTTLEGTLHLLYIACEKARRQGIIIVAAGHNSNDWSYPAIFENVIGVSANRFGSAYDFRYRPDEAMECEAWGVEQPVVWLGGEHQVKHGTSFAAPNITGIVCLLLERHPGSTLEQVREMLAEHAMEVEAPKKPETPEAQGESAQAEAGVAAEAKKPRKPRKPKETAEAKKPAEPKKTVKAKKSVEVKEAGRTAKAKKPVASTETAKAVRAKKPAEAKETGEAGRKQPRPRKGPRPLPAP